LLTTAETEESVRAKVRADLPAHIFAPKPLWSLLVIPIVGLIVGGSVMLVAVPLWWPVALLCAVAIGHLYACLTFVGHDITHGASLPRGRTRMLVTYLSFAVYGVSPHLWIAWHHQAHHGQTNVVGRDPDNFGTLDEFQGGGWWTRFMLRLAPGSGYGSSALYLFLFFTLQGQGVLWSKSREMPDFRGVRRGRVLLDTALLAALWITVAVLAGPRGALLIVLIPMLVSNFIVMSYIVTTHMLCPLVEKRDTLVTSMGVTTWKVFDVLHFHFSHHLEHHLFPAMCSWYYPLVRRSLRRHLGAAYLAPPHWRALLAVLTTPRLYDRLHTLVDPFTGRRLAVEAVQAGLAEAPLSGSSYRRESFPST
jgi:fatty acid desaturase